MGYEVKVIVGELILEMDEMKLDAPELDGDVVYRPYARGKNGKSIRTGRREVTMSEMAQVNLACPGGDSEIYKLSKKTIKGKTKAYKVYTDGNNATDEDCYGKKLVPLPLKTVIKALEKDFEASKSEYAGKGYRRFKWALELLRSMVDTTHGDRVKVILWGY